MKLDVRWAIQDHWSSGLRNGVYVWAVSLCTTVHHCTRVTLSWFIFLSALSLFGRWHDVIDLLLTEPLKPDLTCVCDCVCSKIFVDIKSGWFDMFATFKRCKIKYCYLKSVCWSNIQFGCTVVKLKSQSVEPNVYVERCNHRPLELPWFPVVGHSKRRENQSWRNILFITWMYAVRQVYLRGIVCEVHLSRDMTIPTNWVCAQRRLRSAWASAQSDQTVFAVRMKKHWVLSYPLSAQRGLWSDWANAQADLSLRWAHSHFVGFVMSRLRWTSPILSEPHQSRWCEIYIASKVKHRLIVYTEKIVKHTLQGLFMWCLLNWL